MSKVIEAKAVISAADKTGNVFDKIAAKLKGVEKTAKSLGDVTAPSFAGDLSKDLERLKLSDKELQRVRKSYADFEKTLRGVRPDRYMRAMEDWKGRTIDHWRAVKSSVEEADEAHKRFFKNAGHFALHAAGVGGAAFALGHGVRSQVVSLAERSRANVRYEQMGLSESQLGEANVIADTVSSKFPSISRTEVLDDLRTNTSRLGSFDRAKEIAETYARAKIANKISGGDDHELEQVVRALEGSGKANSAAEFAHGMNMWAKAKAANPDYTGEQFRSDLSAASSSKYGLSKEYLENVFPILASHTSGFGTKLSTGLSALVGGRMTKQVKGELEKAGLLQKGRLVDAAGYISNNYDWTQKHIRPLLEREGVHFGEEMSENDKGKVVDWLQHHFSARNAADLMATNLLDTPLVERARDRKTMDLGGVDQLQAKDAGLALEGLQKQATDVGNSFLGLKFVIVQVNEESKRLANVSHYLRTGELPEQPTNPTIQALKRWWNAPGSTLDEINEQHRRDNLQLLAREWNTRLYGLDEDQSSATQMMRMRRFNAEQGYYASKLASEQNEPLPEFDGKIAPTGALPAVQSLEGATVRAEVAGEVHGEAKLEVTVNPSPYLSAVVRRAEQAIKLLGSLNSNGPGSTGVSSPDAAAPAKPNTGAVAPPISY